MLSGASPHLHERNKILITPETAKTVGEIAKKLQHWHTTPSLESALERFDDLKDTLGASGISLDAFVLREFRISEVFDAMENDEATQDDWWDAVLPNLEWCEYELKKLGFHRDYDALYEIAEASGVSNENPHVPNAVMVYRETPEDMDDTLGSDDRATLITALRYRKYYLDRLDYPQDGTLDPLCGVN